MINNLSLRARITIITGFVLISVCIILSISIIFVAEHQLMIEGGNTAQTGKAYVGMTQADDEGSNSEVMEMGITSVGRDEIHRFYLYTVIAVAIIVLIGIVLIYICAGISLKPVKQLEEEISDITERNLSNRVKCRTSRDEIALLALSFNRMLERLDSAFEKERNFSAGAAHELKTPLAVIKTNLDVLEMSEQPDTDEYEETFVIIKKQIQRMSKLIDDLFAMCALNGYEIEEHVNISDIVEEIVEEQGECAKQRGISISEELNDCYIIANSVMLKHAISNLVENAIKYNKDNGKIRITTVAKSNLCIITVSDTGIGIEEGCEKFIFDAFYRINKSRSRATGGAGLGLAIVKNIVEAHKGIVMYYPNRPQGSIFEIQIPLTNI